MPFDETRSVPNLGASANPAVTIGDPRKAGDMREAERLRELAAWYREFMKRAGNPTIWESRLRMAEELDKLGRPHVLRIYPPVGKTSEDGHDLVYTAVDRWEDDVFKFLDQQLR